MSHAIDARPFPRGVLIGAGALIAFVITAAATARLTGTGAAHVNLGPPVESRLLRFEPLGGGSLRVVAPESGATLAELAPHTNGFVGVVLSGFGRERTRAGISATAPYRLIRTSDGRTELVDVESGQSVLLDAFGADNLNAFNQFFDTERRSP